MNKDCDYCGARFARLFHDQRFCSRRCSEAFHVAERKEAIEFFRASGLKPMVPANRKLAAE